MIFGLSDVITSFFQPITPYFEPTISCTKQGATSMPNYSNQKTAIWQLQSLKIFYDPKPPIFQYETPYFGSFFGCRMIKDTYPKNQGYIYAADFQPKPKNMIFSLSEQIISLFQPVTPYSEPNTNGTKEGSTAMPNHSHRMIANLQLQPLKIFFNPKPPIFQYGTPYFDNFFSCIMIQ